MGVKGCQHIHPVTDQILSHLCLFLCQLPRFQFWCCKIKMHHNHKRFVGPSGTFNLKKCSTFVSSFCDLWSTEHICCHLLVTQPSYGNGRIQDHASCVSSCVPFDLQRWQVFDKYTHSLGEKVFMTPIESKPPLSKENLCSPFTGIACFSVPKQILSKFLSLNLSVFITLLIYFSKEMFFLFTFWDLTYLPTFKL